MTYDELIAKLDESMDFTEMLNRLKALRAVVEFLQPTQVETVCNQTQALRQNLLEIIEKELK